MSLDIDAILNRWCYAWIKKEYVYPNELHHGWTIAKHYIKEDGTQFDLISLITSDYDSSLSKSFIYLGRVKLK
jgi:hypothetical protein